MSPIISNRAVTIYAVLWCVGFLPACAGAYYRHPFLKWFGLILMFPFSLYVAVMTVLSVISFVRAVRRGPL